MSQAEDQYGGAAPQPPLPPAPGAPPVPGAFPAPGASLPPDAAATPPPPAWPAPGPAPLPSYAAPIHPAPVQAGPSHSAPHPQTPAAFARVHQPGAFPLRPLSLGDVMGATFKVIRHNAGATIGAALLIGAVAAVVPFAIGAALGVSTDSGLLSYLFGTELEYEPSIDEANTIFGLIIAFMAMPLILGLGGIFLTGMGAQATHAAAVGRRLSLGQAWAATRGSRWRLVWLNVLISLVTTLAVALYVFIWVLLVVGETPGVVLVAFGVVSVPLLIVGFIWVWVRFLALAASALVIERLTATQALARAGRLAKGRFWPLFGTLIVTYLLVQVAGSFISMPLAFLGVGVTFSGMDEGTAILVMLAINQFSTVLVTALTLPVTAVVSSLLYLDQRIRTEAYDVQLMTAAAPQRTQV